MTDLKSTLERLRGHPGVECVILLGRDGLVIQQVGAAAGGDEVIAARVPALASQCAALGEAAGRGRFLTSVLEYDHGVLIVLGLAPDLLLAVVLRRDVGFAPLLAELRRDRQRLSQLI